MARNIGGLWGIIQIPPNDPETRFSISINQNNVLFTCQAQQPGGPLKGTGSGKVDDNKVEITIEWEGGPVGTYNGVFGLYNILRGSTFDASNGRSR